MPKPPRLLTVSEVAKRLGITSNRVCVYIREGRLKAIKLGESLQWLIEESDLAAFERKPPHRPRKLSKDEPNPT